MSRQAHITAVTIAYLNGDDQIHVWSFTGTGDTMLESYAQCLHYFLQDRHEFFSSEEDDIVWQYRDHADGIVRCVNEMKDLPMFSANLHSFSTTF